MNLKSLFLVCSFAVLPFAAQADDHCMSENYQKMHKHKAMQEYKKDAAHNYDQSMSAKPIAQWTCAEFLAVKKVFQPYAVIFADATNKAGTPESGVLDVAGLTTMVPYIETVCERNPTASFQDKVGAVSATMSGAPATNMSNAPTPASPSAQPVMPAPGR